MKEWIRFPRASGDFSKQAHVDLPDNSFEQEIGREGFFGPATHLYHQHAPTSWSHIEGALSPHAFDTNKLDKPPSDQTTTPFNATSLLFNDQCQIQYWRCSRNMQQLYRNIDGDTLLFVHQGNGELYCDFGQLNYDHGDYLYLPRGVQWRLETDTPCHFLIIEATNGHFQLPAKGMLGNHAIFDPGVLECAEINEKFRNQWNENTWQVIVKRRQAKSTITYPFNPLDARGWQGELCAFRLNWRDIRPVMSHRYHLPPSAHTTFIANGFVVCTFVPRPIESDPGALKVPFYHSNVDYDEFIFYHQGEFFSRDNIHPGMCTLHPNGFPHGPHPNALKVSLENPKKETDEVAIMIDSRQQLQISEEAKHVEWFDYVDSWKA